MAIKYPTWVERTPRRTGAYGTVDPVRQFVVHCINERELWRMAQQEPDFGKRCDIERELTIARDKMAHWETRCEPVIIRRVQEIVKRG